MRDRPIERRTMPFTVPRIPKILMPGGAVGWRAGADRPPGGAPRSRRPTPRPLL
jgi:hypothetical protein